MGVDEVLHQYSRAARELWKFCWLAGAGAGVERTARLMREMAVHDDPVDWWQRGAPRERENRAADADPVVRVDSGPHA